MQSKPPTGCYHRPVQAGQLHDSALNGGLCLGIGLYCAVAGGLAFGLYELMQPTRYPTADISTLKAPSGSTVPQHPGLSTARIASTGTGAFAFAIEPATEARDEPEQQPNTPAELDRAANPVGEVKQTRRVQPRSRGPTADYAGQPTFGGDRSWGSYGGWDSYRGSSGGYRGPGNDQARGNYQGWDRAQSNSRQTLSGYQSRR